jgi:hypothetical protein
MPEFLHDRSDFRDLLILVASERSITPALIEKDYWIMHCLWGLTQQKFTFELKGGTSLSKGFGLISRFSEDIDIRFGPPNGMDVKCGKNHTKPIHADSRKRFFEWLTDRISIPGVTAVRDTTYDDMEYARNAGIRLNYETNTDELKGLKDGILLEVGFDDTTPNKAVNISSWAFDKALETGVPAIDNRANAILCYNPEYTFVEKLQAISTKYRKFREHGTIPSNFLRHYNDVYCLLQCEDVLNFIGTGNYEDRKKERFRTGDELCLAENPAFLFDDADEFERFKKEYEKTASLYYAGQPSLATIAAKIKEHIAEL